jgi:2-desacetyl-2-hydroxyethyl bacteriochlorophyllide A dehydrogenase
MKSTRIVFPGSHQVSFEQEELRPERIGAREVVVENRYSLISPGTELAIYTGAHVGFGDPNNTWVKYPFRPGYSSSGIVIAVGREVEGFRAGDRVLTSGYHCSHQIFELGRETGAAVMKSPEGMDLKEAPFARMVTIPTILFEVARFAVGDCAAVFGLGLIGNFAAQLLRLHGVRVIGIDPIRMRRKAAEACGVPRTLDSGGDLAGALEQICGERGVAAVVEATGNSDLVGPALKVLRPRGQVILLGSPRGKAEIDVYNDVHARGARLIGAHVSLHRFGPYGSGQPAMEYAVDMMHGGFVKASALLTHCLEARDIGEAYRLLIEEKDKALGIVLAWPAGRPAGGGG